VPEWSSRQMIGDRGRRIKRRLGRVRIYKRVGKVEADAAELHDTLEITAAELRDLFDERQKLVVEVRSDMSEARRLTDDAIIAMRVKA
jgi:hypothetical protein